MKPDFFSTSSLWRHFAQIEDVGTVSGGLNSQLDWNLDLNTNLGQDFLLSSAVVHAILSIFSDGWQFELCEYPSSNEKYTI